MKKTKQKTTNPSVKSVCIRMYNTDSQKNLTENTSLRFYLEEFVNYNEKFIIVFGWFPLVFNRLRGGIMDISCNNIYQPFYTCNISGNKL